MRSGTLKQINRDRFLDVCSKYHTVRMDLEKVAPHPESTTLFIMLSLQLHAAKGDVPKNIWKFGSPKW